MNVASIQFTFSYTIMTLGIKRAILLYLIFIHFRSVGNLAADYPIVLDMKVYLKELCLYQQLYTLSAKFGKKFVFGMHALFRSVLMT